MARQLAFGLKDRGQIVDRAFMERDKVCRVELPRSVLTLLGLSFGTK